MRECVYRVYVYENAVYQPVPDVHPDHVFRRFHMQCILALLHVHIHAHTRRCWDGGKSVPDFFLPRPHRGLDLSNNQLRELLPGTFSGLSSLQCVYLCDVVVDKSRMRE